MAYGTLNAGTITPGSGNTLAISEAVTVPTPTATTHAATKAYVDLKAPVASPTFTGTASFSDGNITNVGNIALDTISSDAGTSIGVTLGTDAGDDFNVGSGKLVVEGDTGFCGIGTSSPDSTLHVYKSAAASHGAVATDGDVLVLEKAATCGMTFLTGNTSYCRLNFGDDNDQAGGIIYDHGTTVGMGADTMAFITSASIQMVINSSGNVDISGALSKGSGSFKIDHPLKPDTHHLVHSFIEGAQADLIYRGVVDLAGGTAEINIDEAGRMTEGTFEALCTNNQCFTTNETDWDLIKGSISGNILTISSQNTDCTASISWMVIGERKDQHMIDTEWTDGNGRVITEPEKVIETEEKQPE
jgi:hypothetical protein